LGAPIKKNGLIGGNPKKVPGVLGSTTCLAQGARENHRKKQLKGKLKKSLPTPGGVEKKKPKLRWVKIGPNNLKKLNLGGGRNNEHHQKKQMGWSQKWEGESHKRKMCLKKKEWKV